MADEFFKRLRQYYLDVAAVLRGDSAVASIFPNTTDIGMSRERVYAEFLRHHAPSKCNVFFGGFLFGCDGSESGQLDVIATTDTTPRYDFQNRGREGKSFAPVDGTLGVASIKSNLNKAELEDALIGMAKIPANGTFETTFGLEINNYDDWPYKIIFATDGIAGETLLAHLEAFYSQRSDIGLGRKANVIHVAGKYVILRMTPEMGLWSTALGKPVDPKQASFYLFKKDPDLQAMMWVLQGLNERAKLSGHMFFKYGYMLNRIFGLPGSPEKKTEQRP